MGSAAIMKVYHDAGWSSPVAREAHNLEVAGSNPVPATCLCSQFDASNPAVANRNRGVLHWTTCDRRGPRVRSDQPHDFAQRCREALFRRTAASSFRPALSDSSVGRGESPGLLEQFLEFPSLDTCHPHEDPRVVDVMIGDQIGLGIRGNTDRTLLRLDADNQQLAVLMLPNKQRFAHVESRRAVRRPFDRPIQPCGKLSHCVERDHVTPPFAFRRRQQKRRAASRVATRTISCGGRTPPARRELESVGPRR